MDVEGVNIYTLHSVIVIRVIQL